MKIAFVFEEFHCGGTERVGLSYIRILKEAGHQVDAYVLNSNTEEMVNELKDLCNVKILDFGVRNCPESRWTIIQNRDMHGFEILCFSLIYLGLCISNSFRKLKFCFPEPTYDFAIAFTGHICDLTFVSSNYLKAKHKIAWIHSTQYFFNLISPGYYRLYRKIKNLVCLSEFGDQYCQSYNIKNKILKKRIYNPCILSDVPSDINKIAHLKEDYGDFCLMVARMAEDKDHITAINAMKYLQEKYGIYKHLLLLGDGFRRQEYEDLVHSLNMESWIHFVGTTSDVANYYLSAQILVQSSPLEGLPTVFLEAMSYGLPVVSTDSIPGAREILGNSEYGLICPVGSHEKLAECIKLLHDDSDMRNKYIMKGKERLKDFDPAVIKNELDSFLFQIINGD